MAKNNNIVFRSESQGKGGGITVEEDYADIDGAKVKINKKPASMALLTRKIRLQS